MRGSSHQEVGWPRGLPGWTKIRAVGRVTVGATIARVDRLLLAAVAIALAVAFVSGALTLAVSASTAYRRAQAALTGGVDVYVRGPEVDNGSGISDFSPIPAAVLDRVRAVPGVAHAEGEISRTARLISQDGRFLDPGRSTYAFSWPADPGISAYVITAGRSPRAEGEVVIDPSEGLRIGDRVGVSISRLSPVPATIVGFASLRQGGDVTGSTAVHLSPGWAQQIVATPGRWDLLEVVATRGTNPDLLRGRLTAVLPADGTTAITSRQFADSQLANLSRRAGSINAILAFLSLLALIVGGGVISNTFSILAVQRTRELALLRTVGMSRRQLFASLLGEAAVVGLVASAVGAGAGLPSAELLRSLVGRTGTTNLPPVHANLLVLVAVGLGGLLLTGGVAGVPARRAAATPPVESLRQSRMPAGRSARRTWGPALAAAGVLTVAVGRLGPLSAREPATIAGGIVVTLALLLSLPQLGPFAFRTLGGVLAGRGASGTVAAANVRLRPRQALATASALLIGLGAVTALAVVSSSAHASVATLVRRADRSDLVVVSDAAPGVDPEAVERVRSAPSVAAAAEMGTDTFTIDRRTDRFTALDTDYAAQTLNLPVIAGSLRSFSDGDIAVTRSGARSHGYRIGQLISARFSEPSRRALRITAIIEDNGITRDWIVPFETYRIGYQAATIRAVFVKGLTGTAPTNLRRHVALATSGFPGVRVDDPAAYADHLGRQAEGPILLIEAVSGLTIAVAVLGVIDALSLSIAERAGEFGLLTTLGMTPAQVSLTVQWEAAFVAALGAAVGITCGIVLGVSLVSAVGARGLTRLAIPGARIGMVTCVVVAAAFIGAAVPARRAVGLGAARALSE